MEPKRLSIRVECEYCKTHFEVNQKNLTYQKEYTVVSDGHTIFLTHYDCPECGNRHYVQIDDATTIRAARHTKGQFRKLAKKQIAGGVVTQNQNGKFKMYREGVAQERLALMRMYQGHMVYGEDGVKFGLTLSV